MTAALRSQFVQRPVHQAVLVAETLDHERVQAALTDTLTDVLDQLVEHVGGAALEPRLELLLLVVYFTT